MQVIGIQFFARKKQTTVHVFDIFLTKQTTVENGEGLSPERVRTQRGQRTD